MRLILATAALAATAVPAHAQRLDTRVIKVWMGPEGSDCRLSANQNVRLYQGKSAILGQEPINRDPEYSVTLYITFSPATGASIEQLVFMPVRSLDRPPLLGAHLLIDGADSGVTLSTLGNMDHFERGYVTIPEADRAATSKRLLGARAFEFTIDEGGPRPRQKRFRFDALRISDVDEILSIIHYSCMGDRAD